MGKTAFSGPTFGAWGLLGFASRDAVSTGGGNGVSTAIGCAVVPVGQDWYATDFLAARESTGSTGYGLFVADDGVTVSSVTITSSAAAVRSMNAITPDAGEFAGTRIASGSTITFNVSFSSGTGASSGVSMALYGYPRYLTSTRYAE
jgi:hypothetical protein